MRSPPHIIRRPTGNGHAEAGVREAKRLAHAHARDPVAFYRALLAKRNAPLPSRGGVAASELVFGRVLRDGALPRKIDPTPLQSATAEKLCADRDAKVQLQQQCRRPAAKFAEGDEVIVQDVKSKRWDRRGIVLSVADGGRSYLVEMADDGAVWHRNQRFLRRVVDSADVRRSGRNLDNAGVRDVDNACEVDNDRK